MCGDRSQELPERLNSSSPHRHQEGFPIITPKSRLRQELSGSFVESFQGPHLGPLLSEASALLRPSLYLLLAISMPLLLPSKKNLLFFQPLAKRSSRKPFILTFMHFMGRRTPQTRLSSPTASSGERRGAPSACVFTSLHSCFSASLQYNRCASIRGRNDFQPTSRRNTNRLRAPLLGRQHHRNLRTPLLLRRLCFSRALSTGKTELLDPANWHARRNLRRHGLVPRHLRRRGCRQAGISPCPLSCVPDPRGRVFSDRLHRCVLAGPSPQSAAVESFLPLPPSSSPPPYLPVTA